MSQKRPYPKIIRIRAWKEQLAYIVTYDKCWHEDIIYAPTLREYCNKYGIPMKTVKDLINMLECPNMYYPPDFFGMA